MSWEKTVYSKDRRLDGWTSLENCLDIKEILFKHWPELKLDNTDSVVRWNEYGYAYITWCGNNQQSILHFHCIRKRNRIRWFKKARV